MMLEALANELLHELFEFIDAVELFRAFYGLNDRFNTLLLTHFRAYRINFHSVLKYQSKKLLTQYLPSIINQCVSLRLSNNSNEGSPQTDFFFSSGLQLNQFLQLRSLTLCFIDCETTLYELMVDCHQLPQLTHFTMIKCSVDQMMSVEFCNIIWSLTKLTHCRSDMQFRFQMPTKTSSTLKYLSISSELHALSDIIDLFQRTPNLQCLRISLNWLKGKHHQTLPSITSMTMLKLTDVPSLSAIETILQAMPNLNHLSVATQLIAYNGYQWEQLINSYLPKLKVFHLKMHSVCQCELDVEILVASFRTPFWLEQHQWFIRCHQKSQEGIICILLYTVPYGFDEIQSNMLIESYRKIYSQDNSDSFKQVKHLYYTFPSPTDHLFFKQFSHIRNLSIDLCFDKNHWENVPIFTQLISITILSTDENAPFHLQSLLDRSPHLYSLKIQSWPCSQVPVMQNTSTSLRQLDFLPITSPYFNREQCNIFIHSSLAKQCEELLIRVENADSIFDLVNGMPKLRMLQVQCQFDTTRLHLNNQYKHKVEVLKDWLEYHLHSTRVFPISNGENFQCWIYLEKNITQFLELFNLLLK